MCTLPLNLYCMYMCRQFVQPLIFEKSLFKKAANNVLYMIVTVLLLHVWIHVLLCVLFQDIRNFCASQNYWFNWKNCLWINWHGWVLFWKVAACVLSWSKESCIRHINNLTQVILLELLTAEISFQKKLRLWAIFLLGKCRVLHI